MRWIFLFSFVLFPLIPCLAADDDAPLPPQEAAQSMVLPKGFKASLFAGEPDVKQPIGFCMDDRGRLWVAEAYSYPKHTDQPANDRIVILEDTDGDGQFDKRRVFFDKLNYVTGVEVGFGGAWVMSPPQLLFIPDRDGDDIPDGKPQVVLDGFGNHANLPGDPTAGSTELTVEPTGPPSANLARPLKSVFALMAVSIASIQSLNAGSLSPTARRIHGVSTGMTTAKDSFAIV
jgi:hypothetical protein